MNYTVVKQKDIMSIEFSKIKNDVRKKIASFLFQNLFTNIDFGKKENIKKEVKIISHRTVNNIEKWLNSNIPYHYKKTIVSAIKANKWLEIVEVFYDVVGFGTT